MTERMSLSDFKAGMKKPAKYRNTRVMVDGWPFDSKLEAARYDELKTLRRVGAVAWFLCQVPFRLPGGIIYRADFLVVWSHAAVVKMGDCAGVAIFADSIGKDFVTVEDCKGARTRVSINKIKTVEAIYGIKVTIVTRKTVR